MHDIDRVLRDDLDQPVAIRVHHQRVLGGKRQRHVPRAGALDLAHERTAGRSHHGLPSRRHKSLRHLDGAPFDTAGDQARQHLEHSRRPTSRPCGAGASVGSDCGHCLRMRWW